MKASYGGQRQIIKIPGLLLSSKQYFPLSGSVKLLGDKPIFLVIYHTHCLLFILDTNSSKLACYIKTLLHSKGLYNSLQKIIVSQKKTIIRKSDNVRFSAFKQLLSNYVLQLQCSYFLRNYITLDCKYHT